jgi:hypothetical protein
MVDVAKVLDNYFLATLLAKSINKNRDYGKPSKT